MNNRQQLHPAIQARVNFFNTLEEDVKKATIGNELRILYEKFGNYCTNLNIVNAFGKSDVLILMFNRLLMFNIIK